MAGYDIATLALTVDSQGFVSGVEQASDALGQFQRQSLVGVGTAGRLDNAVQGLWVRMKQLAAVAGASWGFLKMASLAKEVVMLSARYSTLGVVLERVRQNIGASAKEIQDLEKALQKTGISMIESRQQIIAMTQANLDLSHATKLARVAQDAAVVGNTNSSAAFARLIHGLRTGQTDVLRMLGLQVNFQEAEKKLAQELNKTVGALTLKEKQQARVNAVMEQSKNIEGSYLAAMTDAGKVLQSTVRYVEDLKVIIGDVFKPQFTAFVNAYAKALKDSQAWVKANTDKLYMMKDMLVAVGKAVTMIIGLWALWKAAMAWGAMVNGIQLVLQQLVFVQGGLINVTKSAVIFKAVMTAISAHPIIALTTAVLGLAAAFFVLRNRKDEAKLDAPVAGLSVPDGATEREARLFEHVEQSAKDARNAMVEAREEYERMERLRSSSSGYDLLSGRSTHARSDSAKPGEQQAMAAVKMFEEQKISGLELIPILQNLNTLYGEGSELIQDMALQSQQLRGAFQMQARFAEAAAARAALRKEAEDEANRAEAQAARARMAAFRDAEREFARSGAQQEALRLALRQSVSAYEEVTKAQEDDNSARSAATQLWDTWARVQAGAEGDVISFSQALADNKPKALEFYNMALLQSQGARSLSEELRKLVAEQERMLEAEARMDEAMAGGTVRVNELTREVEALKQGRTAYEAFLRVEQRRQFIEKAGAEVAIEYRDERKKLAATEYDLMMVRDRAMQKLQKQVAAEEEYKQKQRQKLEEDQKKQREAIQKGNEVYVNALRGLQEAFAQTFSRIFDEGIDSFKDFADAVVQIFKQMIAQIAAAMLVKHFGLDKLMEAVSGGKTGRDQGGLKALFKQKWSTGGAAIGALAGGAAGYSSGSPLMGGLTGAATGLMTAGPLGAVVGGVAGIIGGLVGLGKKAKEAQRAFEENIKNWDEAFEKFGRIGRMATSELENNVEKLTDEMEALGRDLLKTFKIDIKGREFAASDTDWLIDVLKQLESMPKNMGGIDPGAAARLTDLANKYKKALEELALTQAHEIAMTTGSLQAQRLRLQNNEVEADQRELAISQQEREMALKAKYGQVLPVAMAAEWEQIKLLEREALARRQTVEAMRKSAEQTDQNLTLSEREAAVRFRRAASDEERIAIEKQMADIAAQRSYLSELAAAQAAVVAGEMTQEMFERLAAVLGDELTLSLRDAEDAARDAAKALEWNRQAAAQNVEARIAELTGDDIGAAVIRQNLSIAEEIRSAEEMRDAGYITADAFDRLRDALLASAMTAEQMQAALDAQGATAGKLIGARIKELGGDVEGADQIRREVAVAEELAAAQKLVDQGYLTSEMFDELRTLLEATLLPLDDMIDALDLFGDAVTQQMQGLQNLAQNALGLIGATTEQQAQYALDLLKLNPLIDNIIGGTTSFADAAAMLQAFVANSFPNAAVLASMSEEDRERWENLFTQIAPLLNATGRWEQEQLAAAEAMAPVIEVEKAQKKVSQYNEESVGVLLRLDALQATANVYLREIRDSVAGGALGASFAGGMSMTITVNVNGLDESYGQGAGQQIGGQVAAALDRKLGKRATFSRSSKGAYKPL